MQLIHHAYGDATKADGDAYERFQEALNVLPPVAWTADHNGEAFKISEKIAGTVTTIYVRIGPLRHPLRRYPNPAF